MIHNDWYPWLQSEWQQPYFQKLQIFVEHEYAHKAVYPPKEQIFSAFEYCNKPDVKVVILGQDPYHHEGQAHGMCFSVNPGVPVPPSLRNIYKEAAHDDAGTYIPDNGYLMPWADQGVFLLNTILTVQDSKPQSHKGKGWEIFTDHVIQEISTNSKEPVVFLLWGRNAKDKAFMIDTSKHLVLEAAHPSPLSASRGFFGCRHFSKANAFLKEHGRTPIDWQIPDLNRNR